LNGIIFYLEFNHFYLQVITEPCSMEPRSNPAADTKESKNVVIR